MNEIVLDAEKHRKRPASGASGCQKSHVTENLAQKVFARTPPSEVSMASRPHGVGSRGNALVVLHRGRNPHPF